MKDYYYFLGVENDASDEEIRRAYRKLSLKYHPDKNPGDDFFERRFREVQEAYEQLIDKEKRDFFDSQSAEPSYKFRTHAPPVIRAFSANKIRVRKGDEIIMNWDTANADLVKILPFGLEKSSGEKSFKITEFKGGQFHAVLQATNTLINKSVVQGITFTEIFDLSANKESIKKNHHHKPNANNWFSRPRIVAYILIFVALIMAVFFVFQH